MKYDQCLCACVRVFMCARLRACVCVCVRVQVCDSVSVCIDQTRGSRLTGGPGSP